MTYEQFKTRLGVETLDVLVPNSNGRRLFIHRGTGEHVATSIVGLDVKEPWFAYVVTEDKDKNPVKPYIIITNKKGGLEVELQR